MQDNKTEARMEVSERKDRDVQLDSNEKSFSLETSNTKLTWKYALPQIAATCVALSTTIQAGINMAYSAILLPQLENNSSFSIDRDSGSWVASLVTISTPLGSLLTGPLMDSYGRKVMCMWTCIPFIIAWPLVTFSTNLMYIYVARVLAGFGGGLSTASLVYTSEISHPRLRPMLLCLNSVFVSTGILVTSIMALWMSWKSMAACFAMLAAVTLLALIPLPESPHWLLGMATKSNQREEMDKNRDQARVSMRWFNRQPEVLEEEWQRLQESVNRSSSTVTAAMEDQPLIRQRLRRSISPFLLSTTLRPLLVLSILFVIQQLSGAYLIIFYAVSLFEKIGCAIDGLIDEYHAMFLMALIRFVMSIATSALSHKFGRRTLLMTSSTGMAIFAVAVSIFSNPSSVPVEDERNSMFGGNAVSTNNWVTLVCVLLFVSMSAVGMLVLPWTLVGELLPLQSRGIGGGLMVSFAYVLMFFAVKSFPYTVTYLGVQTTFYCFAGVSVLGTLYVYFFLPETRGKNFLEIQDYFRKGSKRRREVNLNA